jgi:hypothetical protein
MGVLLVKKSFEKQWKLQRFHLQNPRILLNKSDANTSNLFIKIPEFAGNKVLTKCYGKSSNSVN